MSKEVVIRYDDLVQRMQDKFVLRGLMRPVKMQRFQQELADLIEGYREVYQDSLRRNWSDYFPGVPLSEERLKSALNECLEEERQKQIALFKESLRRREVFLHLFGWIFTKSQLFFILGTILAVIAAAIFIPLIFVPTDLAFKVGLWGLVLDVVLFVVLFGWFIQSWTKRKGGI